MSTNEPNSDVPSRDSGRSGASYFDNPDFRLNILWDVDGSLIANDRTGASLFLIAVRTVFRFDGEIAALSHHGKTDRQIILEYIALVGGEPDRHDEVEAELAIVSANYFALPSSVVGPARRQLPGVVTAVCNLYLLGYRNLLMTGNSPARAVLKLRSASIPTALFDLDDSAYGSNFPTRDGMAVDAAARLGRCIVIGDAPGDGLAAQAAGFPFIAVSTGAYTAAELEPYGPVVVIADLERESETFLAAVETCSLLDR